jgi:hypothetical protein
LACGLSGISAHACCRLLRFLSGFISTGNYGLSRTKEETGDLVKPAELKSTDRELVYLKLADQGVSRAATQI